MAKVVQHALLNELRSHRRGGPVTPRVAIHLQAMIRGWRRDPTARGIGFDDWCASLATLNIRMRTLPSCVRMALLDPRAQYVEPT